MEGGQGGSERLGPGSGRKSGGSQVYILEIDSPERAAGLGVEAEVRGVSCPSGCMIFR